MNKLQTLALDSKNTLTNKARYIVPTAALLAGTLAGAQQSGTPDGAGVISGLNLSDMITAAGSAVTQLIKSNSTPLILAAIPVLGFTFIWYKAKSLFNG